MKTFFSILIVCTAILVSSEMNAAVPLNGNYTVGSGGNYPTIADAVAAVDSLGVNGPVAFKILNGTYNEFNIIPHITGASLVNSITFESASGNPDDVIISNSPNVFRLNGATSVTIKNLTVGNIELRGFGQLITISNNKFTNAGITQAMGDPTFELIIQNNTGMSHLIITSMAILSVNVTITGNTFNSPHGYIEVNSCHTLLMEDNIANQLSVRFCQVIRLVRNTITFDDSASGGFDVSFCKQGSVVNNFAIDRTGNYNVVFRNDSALRIVHNTFRSEATSLDTTVSIFNDENSFFEKNIVNNPGGHFVLSLNNNTGYGARYNVYWNGETGNLINYNGTVYNSVALFYGGTGLDEGSIEREVFFVSDEDMHLAGTSVGDVLLMTEPDPLIPVDRDGQARGLYPYIGADEADIPLPVELAAFTYSTNNNNVTLRWSTSSELNNHGFEIERSAVTAVPVWNRIGFVNGNGTQSTIHEYFFVDNGLSAGKYNYRLKQIDVNGNFEYHNLSGKVVIGLPVKYELSQNYPNPFNPSTKISYTLPADGKVSLKIFDNGGKEVASLVNDVQFAGYYTVSFNASKLSSGVYFYKLVSADFSETKKMILVK